ncbi:MAG: hypothetical protein IID28_06070 [Planctomycetes bacterium]|nr:hypothetical protein [Planctomycetota bacterium]
MTASDPFEERPSQSTTDLLAAMDDAVLLPEDDPRRLEILQQLDDADRRTQLAWADRLRESERLRLALRHVEVPGGLEQRLLGIPASVRRPWWKWRLTGWRSAAALAAAVITTAAFVTLLRTSATGTIADAASRLAALAIDDHAGRPVLSVASADPREVEARLTTTAPFAVRVPALDDPYTLLGGRVCSFGSRPIVYTRWRKDNRDHSLYQVRLADFGLPGNLLPTTVTTPPTPGHPIGHRVVIWAQEAFAYALVCDGGDQAIVVGTRTD